MCCVCCVTILKYKYIGLCVQEVIIIWINKIISYNMYVKIFVSTSMLRTNQGVGVVSAGRAVQTSTAVQQAIFKTEYTGCLQKNGAVSKINKRFISHLTRAKRTPSAAATVQVSHALPAVRVSCLMRGRGASFQDGVAAGKGFLCAPF